MPSLLITVRKGRRQEMHWGPGPAPLALDGGLQWMVHGPPPELERVERALEPFTERLADELLLLDFRNSVGRFTVPGLAPLAITTLKCGAAEFELMLGEIARVACSLPFSAGSRARLRARRGVKASDVPYHSLLYLRHIFSADTWAEDAVLPALRTVLSAPHSGLIREPALRPLHQVSRFGLPMLRHIVSTGHLLERVEGPLASSPMAEVLRGHLPRKLAEGRLEESVDTPENRFVKAFLELCGQVLSQVRDAASRVRKSLRFRLLSEIDGLKRQLEPILREPLWSAIGRMTQIPINSTVLQCRRGYREIFCHYFRLQQAPEWLPLSSGDARELLEAKDAAKLYELWCFFQTLEGIRTIWGEPRSAKLVEATDFELRVKPSLELTWRAGALLYNAVFDQCGSDRESYSLAFHPDIALRIGSGGHARWHLFDAKFKVHMGSRGGPAHYKRGDLVKMHGYRDALRSVSARVLYPGEKSEFFVRGAPEEGVGVVPLRPGGSNEKLRAVLRRILCP